MARPTSTTRTTRSSTTAPSPPTPSPPTPSPPTPPPDTKPTGRRIRGLDAEQRKQQRRAQLLDGALELFAANGYLNTSIEQICQLAYVSTKSFYELFDSREACYTALLERITDQIMSDMVDRLRDAPADEPAASRRLVAAFAHALVDDPRVANVTFGQGSAISPVVERQRRTNRRLAAVFLEAIWRRYGVIGHGAESQSADPR